MPSISPIPAACSPRSSACWVTLTPPKKRCTTPSRPRWSNGRARSEEHTSELQSQSNLVCRLLLEKKKQNECLRERHPTSNRKPYDFNPPDTNFPPRLTAQVLSTLLPKIASTVAIDSTSSNA